jgi:hypothetical protein
VTATKLYTLNRRKVQFHYKLRTDQNASVAVLLLVMWKNWRTLKVRIPTTSKLLLRYSLIVPLPDKEGRYEIIIRKSRPETRKWQ